MDYLGGNKGNVGCHSKWWTSFIIIECKIISAKCYAAIPNCTEKNGSL